MASTIRTTGTDSDPIVTTRLPGETVGDWIGRHNASVAAAVPSGDKLTTSWNSANGAQLEPTSRKNGESDGVFKGRHIIEYTNAMIENPPI